MNGIHDMGGMHGMGPIRHEKSEPVFHEIHESLIEGPGTRHARGIDAQGAKELVDRRHVVPNARACSHLSLLGNQSILANLDLSSYEA